MGMSRYASIVMANDVIVLTVIDILDLVGPRIRIATAQRLDRGYR